MTHLGDVARGRDTVARWCNLAERRLEYLTELFETGRWRRFHSERAFLENIQEAKAAVETWRDLMARAAAPDHLAIDLAGHRGKRPAAPRYDEISAQAALRPSEPAAIVVEPLREIPDDVLAALESQLLDMGEAPSGSDAPDFDDMALPPLDLDSIQQRYPLLRNAL
ncbi:TIGR03809 family protein [Afipia sp. GAS231]|uniref:TIGR03809 family protein n=1 Tax=Afipia sp. GAS231 TaxID=1882747 RepID=UPI00087CC20F|nr:TIGR03809 family protein [Afipia sp. GAS231]SDP19497.1 TIGR03809 family protein [Afipia sp. GAS231]